MGPQYLKWEPGNRPRHLRPPCHLTPLVPTQLGKMRRGWHKLPGRSSGPTVSYQYESSVTTFGEGSWQCFFFTDPRVPGLLCKKSIPWRVLLVLLPECFHSPRPQGPACSRPGTSHRDPCTGLPADQSPIPLTSQPEGYFQDQNLTGWSRSKSLARKKPMPIDEEETRGPLEKSAK